MSVDKYTEFDEIRAVLGVSLKEAPDEVLEGNTIWYTLKLDFLDISASILIDYDTVAALPSPNAVELAFKELVTVFASYSVAYRMLDSIPLFSPKSITEGKSNLTRYSDSPYKTTAEKVTASYLKFKKRLLLAYELYKTGGVTDTLVIPLMGVASPDYDPVTGA